MKFFVAVLIALALPTIAAAQGKLAVENADEQDLGSRLPAITAVAIDDKNGWAITGSQAGLIVRSWPELQHIRALPTHLEHIHDLSLSPDGSVLAVAGGSPAESGAVELYQWPAGELWKRLEPHEDVVYAVAWRVDSELFALASADTKVTIFARATAQRVHQLEGHSRPVLAVEFLSGGLGIVTAGVDESLRLWDCPDDASSPATLLRTLTNHTRTVVDLALRTGEQTTAPVIASIGEDSTVRLWQPTIGRLMRFAKLTSPAQAVCWIEGGKAVAVACRDGKVRIVHPDTVQVTSELDALTGAAYCLAADASGALLVGGAGGQLKRLR